MDLRQLNRIQIAVVRAMKSSAMIEAEHGIAHEGLKEIQSELMALIAIKRVQAMAR